MVNSYHSVDLVTGLDCNENQSLRMVSGNEDFFYAVFGCTAL